MVEVDQPRKQLNSLNGSRCAFSWLHVNSGRQPISSSLYVAMIFWGMRPRPVISDSLSALKLMCSYLKALAAVRDWNPSPLTAVVWSHSLKVRHSQNQPSNKFIERFPKPKCPKRRLVWKTSADFMGWRTLDFPSSAGRCQLRSTESQYFWHWRFFSKSQSSGNLRMSLGHCVSPQRQPLPFSMYLDHP